MGKLGIKAPTMVFVYMFFFLFFFAASDLEQKMDNCNQFCVKRKFFENYTNLSLICNGLATPVNVPYSGFNGLALLMGHVKFHKSH